MGRLHVLLLGEAVVVLCFLLRHNKGRSLQPSCSRSPSPTVSRYGTRLRPAVRDAVKELGFGLARLPKREPVLVDVFLAECWDGKAAEQLLSKKHLRCGHNVLSDTRGRLRAVGDPLPGARHDAHADAACGIKAKPSRYRWWTFPATPAPKGQGREVMAAVLVGRGGGLYLADHRTQEAESR